MSIFDNTAAYGLMPEDEQKALREWPYGVLCYNSTPGWAIKSRERFLHGLTYRAVPAPVTKDSIDWSHVADKFNFLSRDSGELELAYLSTKRPCLKTNHWSLNGTFFRADSFSSYVRGTCDWRENLVMRPGYEEDE